MVISPQQIVATSAGSYRCPQPRWLIKRIFVELFGVDGGDDALSLYALEIRGQTAGPNHRNSIIVSRIQSERVFSSLRGIMVDRSATIEERPFTEWSEPP